MPRVELLSPARNSEIGIAAIDCGADSVYIAAPKYGARQQAGNSFEDIRTLCTYAHKFGAKIYLTLNTILYDSELQEAQNYLWKAYEAGIDAVIVQDFALLKMDRPPIPLFASTQTDIRTPEKAALLEKMGYKRLILARELSLKQIREIRKATSIELEFFVHGALCVSCSGQCYLSQYLTGRSANRGECAQACRSNYDLVDENGNILLKDTPIISLKDLNLSNRLEDLIDAGITSFKIEGRLKNISYVKNIVRKYDLALNTVLEKKNSDGVSLSRTSWGRSRCTFTPDAEKTFNRGYTEFFLDGNRGDFKSKDSAKGMGEYIGTVTGVKGGNGKTFVSFSYKPQVSSNTKKDKTIHNSDGLCFVSKDKVALGFRANRCGGAISGKSDEQTVELFTKEASIKKGDLIYRNFDAAFEKQIENIPKRLIDASLDIHLSDGHITISASTENKSKSFTFFLLGDRAQNPEMAENLIKKQLGKTAKHFSFTVNSIEGDDIYFYRTSALNGIRNELAENLQQYLEEERQRKTTTTQANTKASTKANTITNAEKKTDFSSLKDLAKAAFKEGNASYLRNCSNRLSREVYTELGLSDIQPSFEQAPPKDAILMRCKYCIRYQIGMCKKELNSNTHNANKTHNSSNNRSLHLYLKNGANTLVLEFDCSKCEMLVKSPVF
ncbi:MAG: U32 family peptidase [Bacteroidales bacterium]|nr:U32 family peptidase [Bacteroidales bacterium]